MYSKGIDESNRKSVLLIGICGGDFSGKSTICSNILQLIEQKYKNKVIWITQDHFRRKLSTEHPHSSNPEHPDIIDENMLKRALSDIVERKGVKIPLEGSRSDVLRGNQSNAVDQADVVLLEGRFIFSFPEVRRLFDVKIFVDADPDVRLGRRLLKNKSDSLNEIIHYTKYLKPVMEEFCLPTKKFADIIFPWNEEKKEAINFILSSILQFVNTSDSGLVKEVEKRDRSSLVYGS